MFTFLEQITLDPFTDWINQFLIHQGVYAPLLLLLIEEAGIPLPVPGDVVLAYTGYQISKGHISYISAFVIALVAVLAGSSILYYFSTKYGHKIILKFGKYIHVNEHKIVVVEEKFRKYGFWVIIFGRHIPGFRIPITIFAGMSGISYKAFISSTFISVIFWIPIYLSLGQKLGPKTMGLFHAHPWYFLLVLIPFAIFIITFLLSQFKQKKSKKDNHRRTK